MATSMRIRTIAVGFTLFTLSLTTALGGFEGKGKSCDWVAVIANSVVCVCVCVCVRPCVTTVCVRETLPVRLTVRVTQGYQMTLYKLYQLNN